jgi:predicted nucleic acid-binding protein
MVAFLDTNVFLYAAGGPSLQRDGCARVLRRVADGSLDATINAEVLQEILHVLARRGRRNDGITLTRQLSALLPDLLPVTGNDMALSCDLLQRYPSLSVREAVHAGTMLRHGIKTIVSVDPDFDQVREIRRVEPDSV